MRPAIFTAIAIGGIDAVMGCDVKTVVPGKRLEAGGCGVHVNKAQGHNLKEKQRFTSSFRLLY